MKPKLIGKIRNNFGAQVFVAFTVLIFLVSVSFMFLLVRFQYRTVISELENTGKLMAESCAYQARLGLYSENQAILQMPVDTFLKIENVMEVCLFDQNGKVVLKKANSEGAVPPRMLQDPAPLVAEMVERMRESASSKVVHGKGVLMAWAPVRLGSSFFQGGQLQWKAPVEKERTIGYVRVTLGKMHLADQLWAILVNTIILGLVFWTAAAIVTYFLAKQIHLPIKRLTQSVKKFGNEGVCEDLPVDTPNEIGTLAQAFQEMTESLDTYIQREVENARELAHSRSLAQMGMAASKVTHEVGNLLNNLGMVLPPLRNEPLSPKGATRVAILEKEAERLKTFISDFLQFAKRPRLRVRKAKLDYTIREVLAAHQPAADQRNIDLTLEWPEEIPPVDVDRQTMYVAINNLVKNGVEAVGRGGAVTVAGRIDGGDLVITVEDNGDGVDQSIMDNLFEPFYTTKGNEGTGLGLSIVQTLVEAHNGKIACESRLGEGTRFEIRLPMK